MSMTNDLYRLARLSADGRAVRRSIETGSLRPVARRAANRVKGRALARAGFWRWLFQGR